MKKEFLLLILFFSVFFLFACDKQTTTTTTVQTTTTTDLTTTDTTEPSTSITTMPTSGTSAVTTIDTIQNLLADASNRVIISNADNMTTDFVLPAEVGDASVTWSSNNTECIAIASAVTTTTEGYFVYQATVNRPSETVGNVRVTLTGTFAYGSETYQKDFSILVKATFGLTTYNNLLEVHQNATIDDLITVSGFVYSRYNKGYFLTDDSGAFLNVYTTPENAMLVNIGDEVMVTGNYGSYHGLYQVKDISDQQILNSGNEVTVDPIVLTDSQDMLSFDPDDSLLNGQKYQITVVPQILEQGGFDNIYLFSEGVRVATVYYESFSDSELALSQYVGVKVTIVVTYYAYYDQGSSTLETGVPEIWVTFEGDEDDIIVETMSDADKLAIDVGKMPASYEVTTELALPEPTFSEYTNISISTEISDYLSYDNDLEEFVVVRPDADITGSITVVIGYNEESSTIVIPVTMKAETIVVPGDDIFISEYIEGSGYNKYIEIYNPLSTAVDLSEYTLELYSNDSTEASQTLTLSGMLAAGDVIVLSHEDVSVNIYVADLIDSKVINFNGNDALVLKHNDEVVDSIGKIAWNTDFAIDVTLVRKASITGGDTDPTDEYDVSSQWDEYPKDTTDYLGSHTMN